MAYDGHVILREALDVCRKLVLKHDENQFTIQLATDKGEMHNPSRFVYQLEGFSDKWIKTEEVDPNITYMSLHHGNYTLHVRMLNEDGTMGEHEATLKIIITPPLIRNRWLMVAFLLVVGLSIYLWRRRFLKKHAERVELENYRNEIHKKHWMSAMRRKMARKNREDGKTVEVDETDEADNEDVEDAVELDEAEVLDETELEEVDTTTVYEELAPVTDGVKEKTDLVLCSDRCVIPSSRLAANPSISASSRWLIG